MKLIALAAVAAVSLSACAGVPTVAPAPTVTVTSKPTYTPEPEYTPQTNVLTRVWAEYTTSEKGDFCYAWISDTETQKMNAFYNAEMDDVITWVEFKTFFNEECGL